MATPAVPGRNSLMDFVVRREGRRRTEPLDWASISARKLIDLRRHDRLGGLIHEYEPAS
jgi:hypothetical protein